MALPVSFPNHEKKPNIGSFIRLSPFFIGSDNLTGLFNLGSSNGIDLYLGLAIPLGKSKL